MSKQSIMDPKILNFSHALKRISALYLKRIQRYFQLNEGILPISVKSPTLDLSFIKFGLTGRKLYG